MPKIWPKPPGYTPPPDLVIVTESEVRQIAAEVVANSGGGGGGGGSYDAAGSADTAQAYAIQRANHTGTQTADTVTDGTTNKAYTATEKTKLSGVATGATANSTDAVLKARANHTGTQTMSTISDAGTAATLNIPASGNAASGEVVKGTDTRLSDTRTPGALSVLDSMVSASAAIAQSKISGLTSSLSALVALAGTNLTTLTGSLVQFLRVNIPDDASDTSTWPDRLVFFFNGTRTGYFNEYGELRARPGKNNTVSFRCFSHSSPADTSATFFQITKGSDNTTLLFGVSETAVTSNVRVNDPTLVGRIRAVAGSSPSTTGWVANDFWYDTSTES